MAKHSLPLDPHPQPEWGDIVRYPNRHGIYRVMASKPNGSVLLEEQRADGRQRVSFWGNRDKLLPATGEPDVEPASPPAQPQLITKENLKAIPWHRLREEVLYSDGRWFRASRLLPLITSDRNARMLDFLINWQRTYGKSREWFFCSTKSITAEAFIPPTTQPAIFTSLRGERLIETEMRGRSAKRWIKINYRRIVLRCDKAHTAWSEKYLPGEE